MRTNMRNANNETEYVKLQRDKKVGASAGHKLNVIYEQVNHA